MCILQGTFCDTGIPCTFYGGNICSVPRNYFYYFRQVFVHVGGALCGGTILDETTILSAAHCFDDNHVCFMYNFSSSQFGSTGIPVFHDFTTRDPHYFVILLQASILWIPLHFMILKEKIQENIFFAENFLDFFWIFFSYS